MKSFKIILFLLFFFSLQSCGGGDDYFITIDIENNDADSNNNDNDRDDGNDGEDDQEGEGTDGDDNIPDSDSPIPSTPNDNINSKRAYLYIDEISSDGMAHQSAACYGDYAFLISNKMINVRVFNMRNYSRIFDLKDQPPLGTGTIYHCNQACFGTQKYSEEDYFPLLYISQHQNKNNRSFIQVFRVLPTSAGYGQEFTAFAFEKIQTIYFPVLTDDNSLGNVNAVIDTDNHFIYTYSRNNNTAAGNYGKCKISKFNLPNALESTSLTLSDNDILESFFINTSAFNMQGGAYHEGLLYIGRGVPSAGYVYLYVVDLTNRKLWFTVDLLNNGFSWEPEGAYFYKDDLYIGASSRIFKFTFKYENSSAKAFTVPFEITE